MLVLTRRADESILIGPAEGADGRMTLAELFANGPIQIRLLQSSGRGPGGITSGQRNRIGVRVPPS